MISLLMGSKKLERSQIEIMGTIPAETFDRHRPQAIKNLGENALKLMEDILKEAKLREFEFVSVERYCKKLNGW